METIYGLDKNQSACFSSFATKDFYITAHMNNSIKGFVDYNFEEIHHFLFVTGEIGSGKSTMLHLLQHSLSNHYRTYFLAKPFASNEDYIYYLCQICNITYIPEMNEGDFINALGSSLKEPLILFIDTFELMNSAQVQLNLTLLKQTKLKIVCAVRASDSSLQRMYQSQYLEHSILFTCQALSVLDIKQYVNFLITNHHKTNLLAFPIDTLANELKFYTHGSLKVLHSFVQEIEEPPSNMKLSDKKICQLLAKNALKNHYINRSNYHKRCLTKKTLFLISTLESTFELIAAAFLIHFAYSQNTSLYATPWQDDSNHLVLHKTVPLAPQAKTLQINSRYRVQEEIKQPPEEILFLKVSFTK